MALLASRSIAPLVHVVLLVAAVAFHRRTLERRIDVTVETGYRSVLAQQMECRLVMIERGVLPGALVVAIRADRAELALVHVVVAMAVDARARRFAKLLSTRVTGIAL